MFNLFYRQVEPLHVDPLEEPITDVSVGGHDLPNIAQGNAGIWITSVSGRVSLKPRISHDLNG